MPSFPAIRPNWCFAPPDPPAISGARYRSPLRCVAPSETLQLEMDFRSNVATENSAVHGERLAVPLDQAAAALLLQKHFQLEMDFRSNVATENSAVHGERLAVPLDKAAIRPN